MTCLTVTRSTAAEAVAEQAELIVSHHPVLFRAVKRIRADLPGTAPLWMLARAGIAVASPHTAFDNTAGGINDGLCRRLGLVDVVPLAADRRRPPRSRSWSSRPSPIARPCSRRRSRPARGGSGPTTSARSRSRGRGRSSGPRDRPRRRPEGPARDGRGAAARGRLPGRPAGAGPGGDPGPATPTRSRRSTSTRSTRPPRPGPGSGRIGRLRRAAEPRGVRRVRLAGPRPHPRADGRAIPGGRSSGWPSPAARATISWATPRGPAPTCC